MNRLSVSEIVDLLLFKERKIRYGDNPGTSRMAEGKRIHNRLGYDQPTIYRRFYEFNGEWWEIVGMPDRIDQKKGVIEELKSFKTRAIPPATLKAGKIQCQLYCWLTGLERWELIGYSTFTGKASKREEGGWSWKALHSYLQTAITLKKELKSLADEYKAKKDELFNGGD